MGEHAKIDGMCNAILQDHPCLNGFKKTKKQKNKKQGKVVQAY